MAKQSILLHAIGIRLRMLRSVLGHSQADWARALRISRAMLNRWEQGARKPDIEIMILICQSSGCTLEFIYRGQVGQDMRSELKAGAAACFFFFALCLSAFFPRATSASRTISCKAYSAYSEETRRSVARRLRLDIDPLVISEGCRLGDAIAKMRRL
jgi:DNA-binding XRE family transcriptional regulator